MVKVACSAGFKGSADWKSALQNNLRKLFGIAVVSFRNPNLNYHYDFLSATFSSYMFQMKPLGEGKTAEYSTP